MTNEELKALEPGKTFVYSNREGINVRWMFTGINPDGTYQLYGLPFGYEESLMLNSFQVYHPEENNRQKIKWIAEVCEGDDIKGSTVKIGVEPTYGGRYRICSLSDAKMQYDSFDTEKKAVAAILARVGNWATFRKLKNMVKLPVEWACCGFVDIEADSIEEAMAIFNKTNDNIELPSDFEYVDGSFQIGSDDIDLIAVYQEGEKR